MSVSVFTEAGKETLSGLHCRTTVKLFCNATNLLHFRWTYNASKIEIVNFQPDGILTLNQMTTTYSAFPFVQLTQFNAYKNQQNQSRINASTILTVDLSELYKQNIEIISCGSTSPKDTATLPVNISILLPFFPSVTPDVYVSVTIRYESGVLSSVDVSWRKFRVSMNLNRVLDTLALTCIYSNRIVLNMTIHKNTSSMSLDVGGCGSTIAPVKIIFARLCSVIAQTMLEKLIYKPRFLTLRVNKYFILRL